MNLFRYLRLTLHFVGLSHQQAAIYRLDYLMRILRAVLDIGVAIIVYLVLYTGISSIAGWDRYETLLVYGIFQFIWAGNYLLFGYGLNELFHNIIEGGLDYLLTKPIDAQFISSIRVTYITSLFRVVFAVFLIIFSLSQLQLDFSLLNIILGAMSMLSAFVIYYALVFSASVLAFWTFSGEFTSLVNTIATTSRFPSDFYGKAVRNLMLIIPLAFISTVPAGAFLGRNLPLALISPLVATITFFLTRKLWHAGLRSYQSASS